MDSAFKSAPYPGYTNAELQAFIAAGKDTAGKMLAELTRRIAVKAGDRSQMTDGERLRSTPRKDR